MSSEKPDYRVYRARSGLLSRLLNRRESGRFRPLERNQEPSGQGVATADRPAVEPRPH